MLDLEKIRREWLNPCGPCDFGLVEFGCTCPDGDYRNVILALLDELAEAKREIRALTDSDDAQVAIAQGERDAARAELDKTRAELEQQQAALDRVAKFADDMETWCSPFGMSMQYAERLREVLANPATTAEPCDSMNAHDPHDRCPGARSAYTERYPSEEPTTAEPDAEDAEDAPCKTCGKPWRNRRHECEPADEPKATAPCSKPGGDVRDGVCVTCGHTVEVGK